MDEFLDSSEPLDLVDESFKHKIVQNGTLVEELVRSEVWQNIIGPEIHTMIGKVGSYQLPSGKWMAAHWAHPTTSPTERTYDAGYMAGLIEFSNGILEFIDAKKRVVENRAKKLKDKKNETMVYPMQEEE